MFFLLNPIIAAAVVVVVRRKSLAVHRPVPDWFFESPFSYTWLSSNVAPFLYITELKTSENIRQNNFILKVR